MFSVEGILLAKREGISSSVATTRACSGRESDFVKAEKVRIGLRDNALRDIITRLQWDSDTTSPIFSLTELTASPMVLPSAE